MAQKEKDLLLKDLCSRLPYGVLCKSDNEILQLKDVYIDGAVGNEGQLRLSNCKYGGIYKSIDKVKPYLRPLSSMTEKEKKVYNEISNHLCGEVVAKTMIDFCNKHNLDYRGLIEKGLALEAPKDMYNTKTK